MLAEVIEPWQRADFEALDAGWSDVAGLSAESPCRRAWLERSRGHSKTSDIAVAVAWALVFSQRSLRGVAAAGDKDQAKILRDAIDRLVKINHWQQFLDVQQAKVVNRSTGSTLDIISGDAPSSYGLLPDFIVCDEICHWKSRDLWDSLLSSAAKRAKCVLIVITNAGWTDSWQFATREAIQQDPAWYFSRQNGPVASWITHSLLEEQQRLLPDIAYRRLWLNEWSSGTGDALTGETIDNAVDPLHGPMNGEELETVFSAGLDLGIRRDKSALCVVGKNMQGRIKLAYTQTWTPPPGGSVDLIDLEDKVRAVARRFRCPVNFDPWQSELLKQRLRGIVNMREVTFTGSNLQAMASFTLESFNSRSIALYPDEELLTDLRRLRVIEKSYGFRLESPRDGTGHGDLGTAFQLAMLGVKSLVPQIEHTGYLPQGGQARPAPLWQKRVF